MTTAEQLGLNIRELRTRQGLSQAGLAELAAMERHHLSDIELGKRNLSLATMQRLCCALNCELLELFIDVQLDD